MILGYARVSTLGQDLETQQELLKGEGCTKLFIEKVSGTSTAQRIELKNMLEHARKGDSVVVTKIDRLARSIIDLNNIVKGLLEKGVSVKFIKDNMTFEAGTENSINTLLFNILGSFAQFERDLIVERTTEGRERAKKQGKHMGRPSQPKKKIEQAMTLYDSRETSGNSVADIVKITGVPRATIYNQLKKRGE